MVKKIVLCVLIFVLLINVNTDSTRSAVSFSDVSSTDWFYENVNLLVDNGIVSGFPDGTFRPNENITADQFIKTVIVSLGYKLDNAEGYWAQGFLDKARELGIIENNEFHTRELSTTKITRGQMAKICDKTLTLLEGVKTYDKIVEISQFAIDADVINESGLSKHVFSMWEEGIITGYPDRSFRPYTYLTRAEAVTVIRRIIDKNIRKPFNKVYVEDIIQPQTFDLNILVIEINPKLKTKNNIKAHEYLHWSEPIDTVNELISDFYESSHGIINCNVVKWEYINEFPTYLKQINLVNKKGAYSLDEETWLTIMNYGWAWWDSPYAKQLSGFIFDYEYLIEKLMLVERRNNGEFDQVWLVGLDPMETFESIMVGETAYWINGSPILKECDNFAMVNVSIFRRDANIECFGHMFENILGNVFPNRTNHGYGRNYDVNTNDMSLYEKFTLNETSSPGNSAAGNIHFAPNSLNDYDWTNETYVKSTWIDWKNNYPDLTGETVLTNCFTWLNENKSEPLRNHHKWWFSLMPHIAGRNEDGYSHNWWLYFATLDYVVEVNLMNIDPLSVGDIRTPVVTASYQSRKTKDVSSEAVFTSSNERVVKVVNNNIVAISPGEAIVTTKIDGKQNSIKVTVK